MINNIEENMSEENKKMFWSLGKFVFANLVILLLLFLGKNVGAVSFLKGVFADFWISAPFLWYLAISILWMFILSTYVIQLVRSKEAYKRHVVISLSAVWSIAIILAWFLFLGALRWYVVVNINV